MRLHRPHERTEENSVFVKTMIEARESELRSLGVTINSFYELDPDYAASKSPNSVSNVCFGSITKFP